MNFNDTFNELNRLYEELETENTVERLDEEEAFEEACSEDTCNEACCKKHKALKEATDEDEELEIVEGEIEIVDDDAAEELSEEPVEDIQQQVVVKCLNCNAMCLQDEGAIDLEAVCDFCEEPDGFEIVGALTSFEETAPVEDGAEIEIIDDEEIIDVENEDEILEEGIFDKFKKKKTSVNKEADNKKYEVNFNVYDENGKLQYSRDFVEMPGKKTADEQFEEVFKSSGAYTKFNQSENQRDWTYERKSIPAHPFDTKNGKNSFLVELL